MVGFGGINSNNNNCKQHVNQIGTTIINNVHNKIVFRKMQMLLFTNRKGYLV